MNSLLDFFIRNNFKSLVEDPIGRFHSIIVNGQADNKTFVLLSIFTATIPLTGTVAGD